MPAKPPHLTRKEFKAPTEFVTETLLDERVLDFCELIPATVPSGLPVAEFQGCGA